MAPIDNEMLADLWQEIAYRRWQRDLPNTDAADRAVEIFRNPLDPSVIGLANAVTKQANREHAYRTMSFPEPLSPGQYELLNKDLAANG